MTKRTDKHSPKNFDPAAYSYEGVVTLSIPKEVQFLMLECPDAAAQLRAEWLADRKALDARVKDGGFVGNFVNKGTCDHCGAWFLYGAEFHHTDGDVIVVGHTCAEEAFGCDSRVSYDVSRASKLVKGRKLRLKKLIEARAFIVAHDLGAVFTQAHMEAEGFAGSTLEDMHARLMEYGSLSDKQVSFARSLAEQLDTPDTCDFCGATGHKVWDCPAARLAPKTDERIEFTAKILSTKIYPSDYGTGEQHVMTVVTEDGWIASSTIPNAFYRANDFDRAALRGKIVSIKAKVLHKTTRNGDKRIKLNRPYATEVDTFTPNPDLDKVRLTDGLKAARGEA